MRIRTPPAIALIAVMLPMRAALGARVNLGRTRSGVTAESASLASRVPGATTRRGSSIACSSSTAVP